MQQQSSTIVLHSESWLAMATKWSLFSSVTLLASYTIDCRCQLLQKMEGCYCIYSVLCLLVCLTCCAGSRG